MARLAGLRNPREGAEHPREGVATHTKPGAVGEDWLIRGGDPEPLPAKCTVAVQPGDRLRVLTPGGGGWGSG